MKRDWILPASLWAIFTVVGEVLIDRVRLYPPRFAHEAIVSDDAFQLLMVLGVPVFAFVVAMVVTSLIRWRGTGDPTEDGPHMQGSPTIIGIWLVVTIGLAVVLIINPGMVGLAHMRGSQEADLTVNVQGVRWAWTAEYPATEVRSTKEMVLPVHKRVRFDVTSKDILHSFWVPAFRVKIDAVPGKVTTTYATPDRTGSFEADDGLRIQCAELCGLGHAAMAMPIRIVEQDEFDRWLAETKKEANKLPDDCGPATATPEIAAFKVSFDKKCLVVPPSTPVKLTFDNKEPIPHNVSVYTDSTAKTVLYMGELFSGPAVKKYDMNPYKPGVYFFQCDLHPIPAMQGTFVVKEGS